MVELTELTLINAPIERCFDLARSVEVHLAGNVHWGESAVAAAGVTSGLVGLGESVTWRAKHFGVWHTLTSKITAMTRPIHFQDAMIFPLALSVSCGMITFSVPCHPMRLRCGTYSSLPRRYLCWGVLRKSHSSAATCNPSCGSATPF